MAALTGLLLFWCMLCNLVSGETHTFPVHRGTADEHTLATLAAVRRRDGVGYLQTKLFPSLYWFGYFNVGDTKDMRLLLDTGSSDLILNNNLYKPSIHKKPFGTGNFTISYEGVNRAGFGFETINGTTQLDIVTAGNLTVADQAVGSATSFKYFDVKPLPFANPGNGIIGFLGNYSSSFTPQAPGWAVNLCRQKELSECRFGLAFGTNGTGQIAVGTLASDLISGSLVELPRYRREEASAYTVIGDVTVNNTIVVKDQVIIMDVGTDNIQGPIEVTKQILDLWGFKSYLQSQSYNLFGPQTVKVLEGYFDCDKPPTLGFSFPAQSELKAGETATNFNVSPDVWNVYNNGGNNCTSILGGTNALTNVTTGHTAWLLGQSFFAGHYIDFDIKRPNYIGFGNLVDPTGSSSS